MKESVPLIGCGAIGLEVTKRPANDPEVRISQILVRPGKEEAVSGDISAGVRVVSSIDDLDPVPDFVMECASHEAVAEFGPYFWEQGIYFGVISIGSLSDPDLLAKLETASRKGNSQLFLVPGAIGGMDALAAARIEDLEEVTYTSRKPPMSWNGTPAEKDFDLSCMTEATVIYQGSARRAAKLYPKNANVAATIALAGLGFEDTQVTLIADPDAKGNTHHVKARGSFGEMDITIVGNRLAANPESSALTAYSAVRALKNRSQHVCM